MNDTWVAKNVSLSLSLFQQEKGNEQSSRRLGRYRESRFAHSHFRGTETVKFHVVRNGIQNFTSPRPCGQSLAKPS